MRQTKGVKTLQCTKYAIEKENQQGHACSTMLLVPLRVEFI